MTVDVCSLFHVTGLELSHWFDVCKMDPPPLPPPQTDGAAASGNAVQDFGKGSQEVWSGVLQRALFGVLRPRGTHWLQAGRRAVTMSGPGTGGGVSPAQPGRLQCSAGEADPSTRCFCCRQREGRRNLACRAV